MNKHDKTLWKTIQGAPSGYKFVNLFPPWIVPALENLTLLQLVRSSAWLSRHFFLMIGIMGIVEHPWQSFVETYKTYIYIIQLEVSWNWGTPNHPELVYFSIETHGFGDIQFTRLLKVEQLMFAYDGWGGTGLFAVGCGEMEHPSIHHRFWLKKKEQNWDFDPCRRHSFPLGRPYFRIPVRAKIAAMLLLCFRIYLHPKAHLVLLLSQHTGG